MDSSQSGFSVHEILQARILEWAAMPSSRGSPQPRDRTCTSYLHWHILYHQHHLGSHQRTQIYRGSTMTTWTALTTLSAMTVLIQCADANCSAHLEMLHCTWSWALWTRSLVHFIWRTDNRIMTLIRKLGLYRDPQREDPNEGRRNLGKKLTEGRRQLGFRLART